MDLQQEIKAIDFKLNGFDAEAGSFSGLLSVYDNVDEVGDLVQRGAFTKTLQERGGEVPLLWNHDSKTPIGGLKLKDGQFGLEATGKLLIDDALPMAKMAYVWLKSGHQMGMSIGYKVVNSKKEGDIRRLRELKLYEGSLTVIPANRMALVDPLSVKSLGTAETKDFTESLTRIQLWAQHYQMLQALEMALDEARYEDDVTREQRVSMVADIIAQFAAAYTEFFPRYMDMRGMKADMPAAPSVIPLEARNRLAEMGRKFLTMADGHSTTSQEAVGAGQAEEKGTEPDLHSVMTELQNFRWRVQ